MAWFKHRQKQKDDTAKAFEDDFTYDRDDLQSITADLPGEENKDAVAASLQEQEETADKEPPITRYQRDLLAREKEQAESGTDKRRRRKQDKAHARLIDMVEEERDGTKRVPKRLRIFLLTVVTVLLVVAILFMALSQFSTLGFLKMPENIVARIVTPLQNGFASLTGIFTDYAETLKLRSVLEEKYNEVVAENEELTYKALLADELAVQLSQFENMYDEVNANKEMNPIVCRVIGRTDGNYFSTFTINRGSRDGIEEYMAVTISGSLIGYTEKVTETESTVRTIIDSEASIAGLVQSSRDQGTVRGTLGIDGTPMCRMYYLPDNSLPRPGDIVVTSGVGMSFPKGIPIGTVRESTRGMESNKSYVVVAPSTDFQHIEYVIVLRYKPAAQAIQGSAKVSSYMEFVPTETARPYPTLRMFSSSFYSGTATPEPDMTPEPTPEETATPTPEPTATPVPTPVDTSPVIEYNVVSGADATPTPEPTPEPTPSPTPHVTIDPSSLTYEEDE